MSSNTIPAWLCLAACVAICRVSPATAEEVMFRVHEIGRPGGDYFGQTSTADVDNDGDLDFISGRQFGDVFWFENRGTDGWRQHLIGRKAITEVGGTAFDVDGDGWIDQVSGGTWYLGPAKVPENTVCVTTFGANVDCPSLPLFSRLDTWFLQFCCHDSRE